MFSVGGRLGRGGRGDRNGDGSCAVDIKEPSSTLTFSTVENRLTVTTTAGDIRDGPGFRDVSKRGTGGTG